MGEKAEYKSAARSRKLIRQALVDLLKEKTLEKITVTELIKRADINRGTFYAHYQDTRAVIEQIETEVIEQLLEFLGEFRYKNFLQTPLPFLLKIAKYLEEDLEFYRILINTNGSERFLIKLKDIFVRHIEMDVNIPDQVKNSPAFLIRVHFVAGGLVNLYQVWFWGKVDSSLDEMAQEISKIIIASSASMVL